MKHNPPLLQGPLAGVSCAPFRLLAQQWGQPDWCYTEMMSAKSVLQPERLAKRFYFKHPDEGRVCFQLSGTDPDELSKATEQVIAWGADAVDLNCGCPVAKIRKKGAGSKLVEDPEHLYRLVKAMKAASSVPISIKIRVDGNTPTRYALAAAQSAEAAGASWVTVHGRHWQESYETPVRIEPIADIVKAINIPVIANGDARDAESVQRLLTATGAAGIMISRAGVGQPWVFAEIRAGLANQPFERPAIAQIGGLFLQHVTGLIELEGEKVAVLQARKWIKYYARPLPNRLELLQKAQQADTYATLQQLTEAHFGRHDFNRITKTNR